MRVNARGNVFRGLLSEWRINRGDDSRRWASSGASHSASRAPDSTFPLAFSLRGSARMNSDRCDRPVLHRERSANVVLSVNVLQRYVSLH